MARKSAAPAEVFVSHSSRNAAFVKRLVALLTGNGIPSFYSKTSIKGAQQWHDEIGAALGRCQWFLLVLSPDAVDSRWVKHEPFRSFTASAITQSSRGPYPALSGLIFERTSPERHLNS